MKKIVISCIYGALQPGEHIVEDDVAMLLVVKGYGKILEDNIESPKGKANGKANTVK